MQNQSFDLDVPKYMVYGGLGSVVGHEMAHGLNYLFNTTTNPPKAAVRLIKQYDKCYMGSYNGTNYYVNGSQTLNENVADQGGLLSSYNTYGSFSPEYL